MPTNNMTVAGRPDILLRLVAARRIRRRIYGAVISRRCSAAVAACGSPDEET